MRGLGGFFIRRKLDKNAGKKDVIYRAILHTVTYYCIFLNVYSFLSNFLVGMILKMFKVKCFSSIFQFSDLF